MDPITRWTCENCYTHHAANLLFRRSIKYWVRGRAKAVTCAWTMMWPLSSAAAGNIVQNCKITEFVLGQLPIVIWKLSSTLKKRVCTWELLRSHTPGIFTKSRFFGIFVGIWKDSQFRSNSWVKEHDWAAKLVTMHRGTNHLRASPACWSNEPKGLVNSVSHRTSRVIISEGAGMAHNKYFHLPR